MKTINKSLFMLARLAKLGLATVNGYSKTMLSIALAVLFSLSANANSKDSTPLRVQLHVNGARPQNFFADDLGNRIVVACNGVATGVEGGMLSGEQKFPAGVTTFFINKTTGSVTPATGMLNASQVTMFGNSLFYVSGNGFYSYDLAKNTNKLLFSFNADKVAMFEVIDAERVLVLTETSGTVNFPNALSLANDRLAIYNYRTGEVQNVSNNENINDAFHVGGKNIVYITISTVYVFDIETSATRSITGQFNLIGGGFAQTESTFVFSNNRSAARGGNFAWSIVDLSKTDNDNLFWYDAYDAPGMGILKPRNDEIFLRGFYLKEIASGEDLVVPDDECWVLNTKNFELSYVGRFYDPRNGSSFFYTFVRDGENLITTEWGDILVTKLYGKSTSVGKTVQATLAKAYPNPSFGEVNLAISKPAFVSVQSITGRVTFSQTVYPGVEPLTTLPGVNIISIVYDDGTAETLRVIGK